MKKVIISDIAEIPASHEDIKNPGVLKKVLFAFSDFDKSSHIQMINWARMPIGKSFTAHYHQDMAEVFVILQGKVRIVIAKESETLEKYEAVLIPIGSAHKMTNIDTCDVIYLVIGISLGKKGKTVLI